MGALSRLGWGAVLVLAGCTGAIGGDDEADSEENDPGSSPTGLTPLRRLNNTELANTLHDLLGTDLSIASELPPDGVAFGFDTVASGLSVSPLYLERFGSIALTAADAQLSLDSVVSCDLSKPACVSDSLRAFARKAWRRPITDAELQSLQALVEVAVEQGDTRETGIRLAIRAILFSPHFLYLAQDSAEVPELISRPLTDHELAVRLSYFLWSTTPDDELSALADAGELSDEATLSAQAKRMLADGRSRALVESFAAQWLSTRAFLDKSPDVATFPDWDAELRESMRGETLAFVQAVLEEDRPVEDLLTADFTFVNDRLARHYGLGEPGSSELVRVSLAGTERSGILSHGSVATVTSLPIRTSPVKRGEWVLSHLLCDPPPPPPPGTDTTLEAPPPGATLRQQLEAHRENPQCAGCHNIMDPIGLGLEGFDAIGARRTQDNGATIDESGELPNGETFAGSVELAKLLSADERFPRCVTEKLATFAIGRSFEAPEDRGNLEAITEVAVGDGGSLRAYVLAVVASRPFRERDLDGEEN